jgi:cell envelope opacity-associated protein A
MSKSEDPANEKTQQSALSNEELNDLTVTPSNNNMLRTTLTKNSEKYDVEQASLKMDRLEPIQTSKISSTLLLLKKIEKLPNAMHLHILS